MARGWLTVRQAANFIGYDAEHIRNLARRGRIRACKVGWIWLVHQDALLEYRSRMDTLGTQKFSPWRPGLAAEGRGRRRPAGKTIITEVEK